MVCAHGVALFFFQAEDGIRYLVRSRGLGDVYKRQIRDIREFVALVFIRPPVGNQIERKDKK